MGPHSQIHAHESREPEQDTRPVEVADRPFTISEPLPKRLTVTDMQRAFRVKSSTFYALLAQGKFDRFEILPRIGKRAWSGAKVNRYLENESDGRVFGRRSA